MPSDTVPHHVPSSFCARSARRHAHPPLSFFREMQHLGIDVRHRDWTARSWQKGLNGSDTAATTPAHGVLRRSAPAQALRDRALLEMQRTGTAVSSLRFSEDGSWEALSLGGASTGPAQHSRAPPLPPPAAAPAQQLPAMPRPRHGALPREQDLPKLRVASHYYGYVMW